MSKLNDLRHTITINDRTSGNLGVRGFSESPILTCYYDFYVNSKKTRREGLVIGNAQRALSWWQWTGQVNHTTIRHYGKNKRKMFPLRGVIDMKPL